MPAFKQGDLVVYRVGTGANALVNTGNAVFLDEYTPTGALVQSVQLPTADAAGGVHALIASGTGASEGLLTLSADGHYLVLAGYDAAPGGSVSLPGSASTTIGRTVASVDANGTINTSTVLSDYASANNPRGVASLDGQEFWVDGGAGGIRYATLGATTSTQLSTTVTNLRAAEIYAGQLYVSDASGTAVRLGTVGTGTPTTSGQTIANLPGLPTSTGSPYAFVFADLSTSVAGNDTLYVADDGATGGGILKYGLVNGSWTAEGSITAAGVRGLTGSVVNGQMVLYGTTGGSGATGGGSLYSFTDSTGYGQSVSGTAATIATATTNEAFRGIAFAPIAVAAPTIYVSSGAVSHAEGNGGTTSYTFTLTRDSGTSDATVSYSVSGSGTNPADATDFGGTLPRGTATFSGSSLTTTVTITVTGDTTPEPDEQFTVTLSSPSSGYVLGSPASQTGTIVDDDTSTDTTPPTLSAASPANGAADVAIGANVVLTFSEAVKAGTGNIVLHPEDGSADVTIAVGDTSQVTFSGNQVTINPTADLRPGVQYAVVVASGVVTDAAGNGFAGVAQESLDFTTSTAIPGGSSASTFTIQDAGTFTLAAGATRTQTAGVAVQVNSASGPVTVDVEGTLTDTASGQRAINVANTAIPGTIAVGANGSVQSLNADAIRSQSVNGTINLNNQGQIVAGVTAFTPGVGGTNPGTGYAVNFNAALGASGATAGDYTSGGTLTNGSAGNTAALIRADNGDAIRLGSHETLVNYGTINGNGQINDSSDNNAQATNGNTSTATTYDISRGVRINQAGATAVDIENHGTITGAQHGVDTGVTDATNIVVNNAAGASIIGRSGSGVGSDTTGASAATVIVTNAGLIEGDAHPQYDRAGYAASDADGDGVDIDGGATINNLAGGRILATGASGYDSNGRANQSEGISIGGGTIVNAGTIQGAGAGIVVNNDANPNGSRSGVAATTITNDATGTITGQAGYAIRLENKTGTAADDDSIVNYGTITGNGTVPTGTVLLENGSADAGTVGTLNGVSYTAAADAGSARFIQGDGAAIQMGEGNDTLADYGTITGTSGNGKSGLAISLEGGNDTLTLHTGSTVTGGIDGGAGSDTIVLALDDRPATGGGDAGNNGGVTTGTLAQVSNVETLDVQGGTWTIADAQGYGAGVILESGATLVLGTGAQLTGSIADAGHLTVTTTGAITLADPISGAGLVENAGTGTLTLANAGSSYSGGTLLTAGTLDVAVAGAAGTGAIAFGSGAATLHVEAAAISGGSFANAITGFAADGDVIDAAGIGLATASYNAATGVLTLTGTSTENFQIGTGYGSYAFSTAADGASGAAAGTAVTLVSTAPAALSIGDTSVTEGDSGTTTMVFTVSSSVAAPSGGISFHVNTGDGTATVADGDYVALNDYVATIAPGQTSTTVAVTVNGDTRYEANETLTATISQPSGSATIATAQATGTIVNDDAAPTLSIGDARVAEGDSGQATLTFTVTASAPAPTGGITFGIATADGTASSGSDYVAHSATGTIAAGQTSATFTVLVNGDTTFERDETVLVNLSSPTNATIAHGQGVGTIENDDAPPATQQIFSTDFASFTAAGFAPGGVSGGLDSTVWRVVGLSDNTNPAYGFTGPAGGDFGRGVINGSADPVSAGVYSPSADHALVVQPTGAELDANGTIEARIQNTSGATATSFDVAFDWAYRNSGARADNLQLAYSTDGTNFTPVSAAAFTTPATADATVAGTFTDSHEAVSINGTVAGGGYLYLRWIHASSTGGGSRDEVGIDNVGVTAHLSTTPTASVGDISVTEGNSGTTNAVFTITRSNGAGSASVDYATADGTAVSGSDYVAQRGTVTFAPGETSKTVTVLVDGDTQHEANETFTLNLSNATGFQVPQTSATATIVNDDTGPVAIYDIQGLGHRSPFTGQSVSTSGVVTAVKSNGFFLQDPTGDGNIGTSDAIFVVTSGAPTVSVGNAVSLTGTVTEYATATNYLSLTELTSPSAITVTAASAALPAAVVIATDGVDGHRAPPTSVIEDDNFHSYDPTTDGIDFYESLEGMRVTIRQPLVVANTDANGQTFVVASDGVGATGLNDRSGMTISSGDNNPETLKIYEGSSAAGAHSQGDVLNDVTGTLTYFGGRYEVDPTGTVTVAADNPPLARETTTLVGDANHLSYASFNIENFSPRDQDYTAPETAASKVQSLATEVITALHSPNVIGLQEVQDNDGEGTGTDLSGAQNVQRLIDAIAAAGGPTYRYLEIAPTATNISGGAPDGNIRNGFLYDPTKVSYVDGSLHVLTDAAFNGTRKPLVADFTFNGQTFTAIDQHSTSRGGSDPLFGTDQPPVAAGDAARTAQASAIKSYVDSVLARDPGHQFVVNGDFNGFPYENALQALAAGGTLDNLYDKLPVQERYSYYFDGYYQAFDNIIVSHALSANTTFDIVHYNAGFTDGVSVTDHDQAIAEIGLARSTGAATAVADGYATTAVAILHGTVLANDTGGGSTLSVAAVNGDATQVGTVDHLASGATLTLLSDGTFSYDTDGAFSYLAAGATTTDQFSYTLAGGSTALATVTVTGVATPAPDSSGHLDGTSGNDTFGGTTGADYFDLSAGGTDTVSGGAGADAFYMGAALTAGDHINGGSGDDQVGLLGDYTGANAIVLSATTLTNVETLAFLPGGSTPHSYDITSNDATVAAGQIFTVFGGNLAAGESLSFNGSAETDGSFLFFGGAGTDTFRGGANADGFFFGPDKFGTTDVVHGGGGIDQLGLDGHSAALTLDSTHTDVEVLALLHGPAGSTADTYGTITVDDSWVAAGQTKTITAVTAFQSSVGPVATSLVIDGSHETDGNLVIYGGSANDTLTGGAGADHLYGGLGADTLTGGAGADTFVYNAATESTSTGFDTLTDFTIGTDVLQISGQGSDSYAAIRGGTLSAGSFDADLQAAVGAQLSSGHAVFFTATAGDYANQTFLVVDGNGSAGYQAGGDFVFHVPAAPIATMGTADFITH